MVTTWIPDPDSLGAEWEALAPSVKTRALRLATSSLQMLTYYRVGTEPVTVRPCPVRPTCGCGPVNPCGCVGYVSEIDLPGPVGGIYAIIIDGRIVAASEGWERDSWDGLTEDILYDMSAFRVDNGHLLVWQGEGESPFLSVRQDLGKPLSHENTWGVVYSRSYPVGEEGRIAVALLAKEYAKGLGKINGKCSLPKGVTNVVRNGVTFTIEAGLFPGGLTGNDIVDAFILQWAPAHSPIRTASVFDPKKMKPRRPGAAAITSGGSF